MEYKQYTLEELHNMFEKEQNPKELNKILGVISYKHDILSDDNKETNNVQLEEEIYQQMSLIKPLFQCLNISSLLRAPSMFKMYPV